MSIKKAKVTIVCLLATVVFNHTIAQHAKPVYHPCFLMDSVEKNLVFIERNALRVFADTFDCRQTLLDSIASKYIATKNKKYLDALNNIRVYANEKVENLYTDIIRRMVENNFTDFLNELYLSNGRYQSLEKELVATMNMMIDGRPYKKKFLGLFNVQIQKAKDGKDSSRLHYLEKLKYRIEEEQY